MQTKLKQELNNRLEYKYWISDYFLDEFRADMLPYMSYDPYAASRPEKQYTVRSVYLDTRKMKSYHEKMDGIRYRNKYRIRGYNTLTDSSQIFLEIKQKNIDFISKTRVKTSYSDFLKLKNSWNPDEIDSYKNSEIRQSADKFIFHYLSENLIPITNVTYDREAFFCNYASNLRISFDKAIRTRYPESISDIHGDHNLTVCRPGYTVIEIKFYQILPAWVPAIVSKYKLKREAISKYTMCVDTLRKQHSLLTGTFS